MNTIYHYTDLQGFFGIIQTQKLWLSAANNLNDTSEVNWFIKKLNSKLAAIDPKSEDPLLLKLWKTVQINNPLPYICSFSENGDLLSQWRAYADDGKGVAIGFNKDYFGLINSVPTTSMVKDHTIGMCEVYYDENVQEALLEKKIRVLRNSQGMNDAEIDGEILDCALALRKFAYIAKNPAFREEKEIRIIHTPLMLNDKDGNIAIYGNISDLKYRISGDRLTSFFELNFSPQEQIAPITEIVIGPKSSLSNYDVESYLSINSFGKTTCRRSAATYR